MQKEQSLSMREFRNLHPPVDSRIHLSRRIIREVTKYARAQYYMPQIVPHLQDSFALYFSKTSESQYTEDGLAQYMLHHAFNDLLYLFNDNHDPNTDPSGFIHKGNACRLLVYPPNFANVKMKTAYGDMDELVKHLSKELPTADTYPALYYDVNEAPHLMVQRVGIAQLHTRLRDFDFAFTGIQQTMQWGNDETKLSFHVVQEEKQGKRISKPVEINPYIFTQHYRGK